MTATLKKMPPPPPIAVSDPIFNRWLHDLTAFLSADGSIDTGAIPGYDELVTTVDTHTTEIASNTTNIAANTAELATHATEIATNTTNIATNTTNIAANTTNIAANTSQIAALTARSQVLNGTTAPAAGLGVNGDWYADTTNKHISVKVSGAWVQII